MKKSFNKFNLFLCILIFIAFTGKNSNAQFKLTILHNNDGESKLINAGTGALQDFGGVARFKTLLDSLRAQSDAAGIPSILLSSGDNFLAGPEFYVSQQLPYNTPYYDVVAMNSFGYSAICMGNHEFDFGPDILAKFIRDFSTLPKAPWLSSNLGFSAEDSLNMLVLAGRIAPKTILNINGEMVGIIGATTPRLPYISSPRNVTVDTAVASVVQSQVDELLGLGVNKIILISHLQTIAEDTLLCKRLSGVDVMIAGGGSEVLANPGDLLVPGDVVFGSYPLEVKNINNVNIPIITTEGNYKYIGKLVVEFDGSGDLVSIDTVSGPVRVSGGAYPDAVQPNQFLEDNVTTPLTTALAGLASSVVGVSNTPLNGIRNDVRSKETNVGNLITDAFLWQATLLAPLFNQPVPQIALQNGGGIRNNSLIPSGNISELNVFSIVPFANFLSIVPDIPRSQLKEILENAVEFAPSPDGRFAQVGGMYFKWNPLGVAQVVDNDGNVLVPGTRVVEVRLNDGALNGPGTYLVQNGNVVPGDPITIATIDFSARGGDQYPFRNAPFTTLGVTYQQALSNYIRNGLGGTIDSVQYPNRETGRIVMLDQPLPVELTSFLSNVNQNNVRLDWTTASEINNSGFEIERSLKNNNNQNWVKAGFVTGNGNSNIAHSYTFEDKGLNSGTYAYRLKQIDFNGNFEYFNLSNEVVIGIPERFTLSQNYPNPFNPVTKINYQIPSGSFVSLKVYDIAGNEVASLVNQDIAAGSYSIEFNASDLSSGVYYYKMTAGNFSDVKKLIVLK